MNIIIVGTQFGDEGKGKLLNWLIEEKGDVAVRFNGGSNAGHTISINGIKYYTHVLPSGVISKDKLNLLGSGMVIGLDNLLEEINDITKKDIDITNRLFISDRAHIVLTVHKKLDLIKGKKIGTTGQGIGPCYGDKSLRRGLRICDICAEDWKERLDKFYRNYYDIDYLTFMKNDEILIEKNKDCNEIIDYLNFIKNDQILIEKNRDFIKSIVVNEIDFMNKIIKEKKRIIFEGANATMLDINYGTYPNVTSSICTVPGVFSGSGMNPSIFYNNPHEIIGVVKAYTTRVGNGKLITESIEEGKIMQIVGGEIGVTTGRIRRCGWLDLPQLKYSIYINGITVLNITKLDVLSEFDNIKVCIKYLNTKTNTETETIPSDEEILENLEPIYVELLGWKNYKLSDIKNYNDLHPNIKNYIEFIEKNLNIPIKYINTGQDKHLMIIKD